MASGSSSSSMLFNSQQDPNPMLPTSLVAASVEKGRHICEVCYKGFARKQNLTLHQRSHNLLYSLKTRTTKEPMPRKVYLCPEPTCRHHSPSRALGDFGGLKKHYLRKHCDQKKYKCDICYKAYTVETDLRAHLKSCGKKRYICHCGARVLRGYKLIVHQENCEAQQHEGAAKHSPMLDKGVGSVKSTFLNNRSIPIGSTSSPPLTFEMRDNPFRITTNDNIKTLIGPKIFSIENPSNSYQSQLCQFGTNYGSLMTDPFSIGETYPAFFSPSPTQQSQLRFQSFHESSDTRFYADLLMDKIPLNNLNLENMNILGDSGNIYGRDEGSNSFSGGGFTLDHSSSLHSTPAVHSTSLNSGMLNTLSGFNGVDSSTINQDVGGGYEQWGNYGYGNGFGSGRFDYGGGREVLNFVTSAETTGVVAPSDPHFNQSS